MTPRRLLVVSATIGEGHNATARAVEERAQRLWPGCEIHRVDTLDLMGRWVGPGFRWIYRVNVDTTPWLYDFFYRSLWRYPWFATASCRFVGVWSGQRLAPVVKKYRPDLVVSTYPLGTAGLDWIRRRGGLEVPVVTMISDFAPHPFWVYPEIDLHYVASEPSLRAMYRAQPDARGAVGAPPVVSAFAPVSPVDKAGARRRFGLPQDRLVVLVSCGSLGFGSVQRAVGAALAAGPGMCVVVACGRNEALRARLAARGEAVTHNQVTRLVPLGWSSEMPALTAAADVVVTNAGGATALEALACGRAVLMFEPIAGHGKANAALMADAGLARLCTGSAELIAALRELTRPDQLAAAEHRAQAHIKPLDLNTEIAALPELPRHHGARPLAAPDAFFAHAATTTVPQLAGAVLLLERELPQAAEQLAMRITERALGLPMLRRRLELRRGRWPRWLSVETIDPSAHLQVRTVGAAHHVSFATAVQEFFATPVPLDLPPWQLAILHDPDTNRTAVLAKLHHSLGDGLAMTTTLLELITDHPPRIQRARRDYSRPVEPVAPAWGARIRGLVSLAKGGLAPPSGLGAARPCPADLQRATNHGVELGDTRAPTSHGTGARTRERYVTTVELPAAGVRACAREHGVGTTAFLVSLVADALHRLDPAGTAVHDRVRAMVPRTTQALRRAGGGQIAGSAGGGDAVHPGYQGNHTAAIAVDLPVGPMPPAGRVAAVASALARQEQAGQPVAAQAVVRALGHLPAPLHATLVRAMYGHRFFSLITSVLPGSRKAQYVWGVRIVSAFPVLPLADGVGLAIGFLAWGDMIGVGVTTDIGLLPSGDRFATALHRAFEDLAADPRGVRRAPETARE